VRIVVPFPPGQSVDVLPRILAEALSRRLPHPVVVENRPGGVGTIGTEVVVRAAPDGHTLGMGAVSTLAVNPALLPRQPYDIGRDLAPVAKLFDVALALAVNPSVPAADLPGLVRWLRDNPGARYASAGPATTPHLTGELFAHRLGLDLVHVPYRGSGPAMSDVVAGVVPLTFDTVTSALPQARGGRLRLLAITTAARLERLPETPTVAETVSPGFEAVAWGGLVAPAGTPEPLIKIINAEIYHALVDPAVADRFADLGAAATPGSPEAFRAFIRAETEKWGGLVRATGVRLDG
jgi:tripartite-type tricarboxylate transporter receptor subunit TctC